MSGLAITRAFAGMKARLAVRNLTRSGGRLWVSLFGIAFATLLMAIQGSLLYSFTRAASRVVDAIDADIVMVSKGVPTFDYVAPIPERYASIALGVDGVAETGRGVVGWSPFKRPDGEVTLVFQVGVERRFIGDLPDIGVIAASHGLSDWALAIDVSDAHKLQFTGDTSPVEVAGRRGKLVAAVDGFSSFLGSPYLFADYGDTRQYVGMDRSLVSFVLVRAQPGIEAEAVRQALRARFADVDVWTRQELSSLSRWFWLNQTGAGGALSLAAILGFFIGLVLVAQTIYSITAENLEEYATLKAMGASNRDVHQVVLVQSLFCGVGGGIIGLLAVAPFAELIRPMVAWITVPAWIYVLVAGALAGLCTLASVIAARPAVSIDPARVFRA